MSTMLRRRRLLPLSLALVIGAPAAATEAGDAIAGDAPIVEAGRYPSLGRFSFPVADGLEKEVFDWGCRGGRIPDLVLRWDCAGNRNTYLLGHASSVFNPVADAYRDGRLRPGRLAYWTRDGVTRTYRVTWVRRVGSDYVWKGRPGEDWAWNATRRAAITLQTCWGAASESRLIVRMVIVE